jgi:hypothetical protein
MSLFSSFGVSLFDIITMLTDAAEDVPKYKVLLLQFLAASVQVRQNVNFIRVAEANDYPVLSISSLRPGVQDMANFKAYHVAGHMMAALISEHPIAQKINEKGNCVIGGTFPDTPAGKVNKEVFARFSDGDRTAFRAWMASDEAVEVRRAALYIVERATSIQKSGYVRPTDVKK